MNIICILFGTIFIVTGILFATGKLHTHIKAWKRMSEDEKKTIDINPLCFNIGAMIALAGLIFIISGFVLRYEHRFFIIGMIIYLILSGLDLYYIEKSGRYIK